MSVASVLLFFKRQFRGVCSFFLKYKNILTQPSYKMLGVDLICLILSFPMALWLKLGSLAFYPFGIMVEQTIAFTLIASSLLMISPTYKGVWHYISGRDLVRLVRLSILSVLMFAPYLVLSQTFQYVPFTALFIHTLLLLSFWIGARLMIRAFSVHQMRKKIQETPPSKAILVGVGIATNQLIKRIFNHGNPLYDIVGILDTKERNSKRYIHGIPLLGHFKEIHNLMPMLQRQKKEPEVLIIGDATLSSQEIGTLIEVAHTFSLKIKKIPLLHSKQTAPIPGSHFLKLSELFKRSFPKLDQEKIMGLLKGKKILITGASGTLGRAFVEQIVHAFPEKLLLLDYNDYGLVELSSYLKTHYPQCVFKTLLGDIRHKEWVDEVVGEEKPDFILHAAALKQKTFLEEHPTQGILTNVLGTKYLADAAKKHQVTAMLLVSTQDAESPESILGLTKMVAEKYCQSLDTAVDAKGTKYLSGRLTNIIGSKGSVIEVFEKQIEKGEPVTVTHPQIFRYFMTASEAAHFLLQALCSKTTTLTPRGSIFTFDISSPISILEIAETLIKFAGLRPYEDISIRFTGLQKGEVLQTSRPDTSKAKKTPQPHIFLAHSSSAQDQKELTLMTELETHAVKNNHQTCLTILQKMASHEQVLPNQLSQAT